MGTNEAIQASNRIQLLFWLSLLLAVGGAVVAVSFGAIFKVHVDADSTAFNWPAFWDVEGIVNSVAGAMLFVALVAHGVRLGVTAARA